MYIIHFTTYVFLLAKSLQLIYQCNLQLSQLVAHAMHGFQEQLYKFRLLATVCFNKTIFIRFGFCDILNNRGLSKCYQPRPLAQLITLTSTLII